MADNEGSASVLGSTKSQAVHISSAWNTLDTDKKAQAPELAVPDQDVERTSVTVSSSLLLGDPFQLSDGIVPDEKIASLRRHREGKRIAKYQLRQNNVCVARVCIYLN